MSIRTIGVKITGKKDVEDLQKSLNNSAALIKYLNKSIKDLNKGGDNNPSFSIDVGINTRRAEKQLKGLEKSANSAANSISKVITASAKPKVKNLISDDLVKQYGSIGKQLEDVTETLGKRVEKSQKKLTKKLWKLGDKAYDSFVDGFVVKGGVANEIAAKISKDLTSAVALVRTRKLKVPIKATADYTLPTTSNGYIDTSADALRKAQERLLSYSNFSKNTSGLNKFVKNLQNNEKEARSASEGILASLRKLAYSDVWDKLLKNYLKLSKISLNTTLKPAAKVGSFLGNSVQSQLAQTGNLVQRVYSNAFNTIQNTGSRAFSSLVTEARELGDAVTDYGIQMKALGMSQEDIAKNEQEIINYGKNTAYNGKDLIATTGVFQALGVDDSIGLTKAIAGLAAGTKNPNKSFNGIQKQLQDAMQSGKLQWQDVKIIQQWQSAMATKKMNDYLKSNNLLGGYNSLKEAIAEGAISVETYAQAIKAVGLSDELQSLTDTIKTPSNALANLKENLALIAIGVEGADGAFKGLYDTITDIIKGTADWIKNNEGAIRKFGDWTDQQIAYGSTYAKDIKETYGAPFKQNTLSLFQGIRDGFNRGKVEGAGETLANTIAGWGTPERGRILGDFGSDYLASFINLTDTFATLGGKLVDAGALDILTGKLDLFNNIIWGISQSQALPVVVSMFNKIYEFLNGLATNTAVTSAVDGVVTTLANTINGILDLAINASKTPEFADFITFLGKEIEELIQGLGAVFTELAVGAGKALASDTGKRTITAIKNFIIELANFVLSMIKAVSDDGTVEDGLRNILGTFKNILNFLSAILKFLNEHPTITKAILWTTLAGFASSKVLKGLTGLANFILKAKGIEKTLTGLDILKGGWKKLKGIPDALRKFWSYTTASPIVDDVVTGAGKLGGAAKTGAGKLGGLAKNTWGFLKENLLGISSDGTSLGAKATGFKGGLKGFGIAAGGTLAVNGINALIQGSNMSQGTKAGMGMLTNATNWGMTGASVGSMVAGPVGTIVGGIVGAAGSAAVDLFNSWKESETMSVEKAQETIERLNPILEKARALPFDVVNQSFEQAYSETGSVSTAVRQALEQNGIYDEELQGKIVERINSGQTFSQAYMESVNELQAEVNHLLERTEKAIKDGKNSVTVGDDQWEWVTDKVEDIKSLVKGIIDGTKNVFKNVGNALKNAWDTVVGWFQGEDLPEQKSVNDKVIKKHFKNDSKLNKSKFNGGLIYRANGGGVDWTARGTDTIPAMLTKGEYVLRKKAVDSIGTAFLNRMNRYGAQALTTVNNGGNRTIIHNYYNTNNARMTQNIDNKSQYLNGMDGLDRLMRYV